MARTELFLKFDFTASHSLAQYEKPHPHLWKLEVSISGRPNQGMIVDMLQLRGSIEPLVAELNGVYLNDAARLTDEVRSFPTCETLAEYFLGIMSKQILPPLMPLNPSLKLEYAQVTLCDPDGIERGSARVRPDGS